MSATTIHSTKVQAQRKQSLNIKLQREREREREMYSTPFLQKLALAFTGDRERLRPVLELTSGRVSMNRSLSLCYLSSPPPLHHIEFRHFSFSFSSFPKTLI